MSTRTASAAAAVRIACIAASEHADAACGLSDEKDAPCVVRAVWKCRKCKTCFSSKALLAQHRQECNTPKRPSPPAKAASAPSLSAVLNKPVEVKRLQPGKARMKNTLRKVCDTPENTLKMIRALLLEHGKCALGCKHITRHGHTLSCGHLVCQRCFRDLKTPKGFFSHCSVCGKVVGNTATLCTEAKLHNTLCDILFPLA